MRLTFFQSPLDRSASTHETTWPELCAWLENPPTYPSKDQCPLIKLAVFGNAPSPKGMMRHDANVVAITGVEADYDGEQMPFSEAVERLRKAGITCVVYTSASHLTFKDGKQRGPRWRVLVPLSVEYSPDYRRTFLDYVNEILGGVIARESWALSGSYYCGRVDGVEYEATTIDGKFLDEIVEPKAIPLQSTTPPDVPEWRHVDIDKLPLEDDTKRLIRGGADKGGRSEALMTASNALARARVNPDDILRILSDPTYAISAKALENRRQDAAMAWLAKHTVRKALEAFPPVDVMFATPPVFGTQAKRVSLFASATELIESNEPIDWLITDIIEKPVLGMIFGDPGAGKSFVALDWAASIATGSKWHERKVAKGGVAYIAGEGFAGIKRRLKAWSKHRDVDLKGAGLYVSRRAVNFGDARALGELHGELDAQPERPVLVVVDTLQRMTPGLDQNSVKEAGLFIGACDRLKEKYDCTVLVVHHSGHADKGRAMGSMAFKGSVDWEAAVQRDPKRDGVLSITSTKMKDGDPFKPIWLRFEPVQLSPTPDFEIQSSAVLVAADEPPSFKMTPADELLRDVLDGGTVEEDEAKAKFCEAYDGTKDAARKAWSRALDRASRCGLIAADPDAHTLTAMSWYRTGRTVP